MKKYSSGCKLRRIKAVNRNRNEIKFYHLESTIIECIGPFQKCLPIIKKIKKGAPRTAFEIVLYPPSQCASPASAGSHCAGLKSIM